MKLHTILGWAVALALPACSYAESPAPESASSAQVRSPEYQNPETRIHEIEAPSDDTASPWPFAASDLPVDPAYRFGVLGNGMRFIIRPNGTPEAQGMVYLWINSGSLGEDEDQQGYAHFVEHMAFNGTTNVPEGEMIRLLERDGLAFGADTNASTGFDKTIYKLSLPRNEEALLDTALMLMRETAGEILFEPEAVAREIGVIQSERRVRDTYQLSNQLDQFDFLFPGSQLTNRWIGGTDETIDNATSERLRDYYERFYRPDNAAVIVVGDFEPDAVEGLIRRYFADWSADPVEPPASSGPILFDHQGETDIFIDPALSEAINITRHGEYFDRPDTIATRQERILRQIGYAIINRRMQSIGREEDPPFRAAGMNTAAVFKDARSTSLVVQAAEGEWQRGLAAAQAEFRQALEFGFTAAEVAEQVANLRASIEANAAGAETFSHNSHMNNALTLLDVGQVPTTPQSGLERFEAFAPLINADAVLQALRADIVMLDNPLIRFTGRSAPEGGTEALRVAWDAGMAADLTQREEEELAEFAYTEFGIAGSVVSDEIEPQLGIRTIRFANGLMLNLKQTELQEDRISVQLNIDGGDMLNTREEPLAAAMTSSLIAGGLGAHTLDELQTILAGAQVGINLSSQSETFQLYSTTTPRDFELQLQVMAAVVTDPGYRSTGEEQYRRNVANWFARREATPSSSLSTGQSAITSDNDPRFSLASEEDYLSLTIAALRDVIADRLANGAMELAIVGDIEEEEAIALVARTLGALPQRETDFQPYADNRTRSFTQDRNARTLYHDGEDNQAILRMIWPTRDDSDLTQTLELGLLERVVRISLTDVLREELGQIYSPGASASQSRTYTDYGTFAITAPVNTSDLEAAREAMIGVIENLRSAPVDADLMQRARAPQLEAYDNLLKTNGGWMGLVDRAQTEAERIDRFMAGKDIMEGLTGERLQAVAQQYLNPEERLEILVIPREAASPGE